MTRRTPFNRKPLLAACLAALLAAPATARDPAGQSLVPDGPGAGALDRERLQAAADGKSRFDDLWPEDSKLGTKALTVNCDRGQSLAQVLERPGNDAIELKVYFDGTCTENVTIRRDRVTLRGVDDTAIIAGGLTLDGAQGVTLRDFSVRDSAGSGIFINGGSVARLENLDASNNAGQGISLVGSAARVSGGIVAENNGGTGISVDLGSELRFSDSIRVSDNGVAGIIASSGSHLIGSGFAIEANRNPGAAGIEVQISSSAFLLGGTITANENSPAGLLLQIGSSVSAFFVTLEAEANTIGGIILGIGSNIVEGLNQISARNNGIAGLALTETSSWTTFASVGSALDFSNNLTYGLRAETDSVIDMRGANTTVTVRDNGEAGVVVFDASGRFQGLTATGNADADFVVDFGARGSLLGEREVGSIFCGVGGLIDLDAQVGGHGAGEQISCDLEDVPAALVEKVRAMRYVDLVPVLPAEVKSLLR